MGFIEYHNTLYGDATRGCHHRGNGPDARKRTIFDIRQRLGVLIIEDPRRSPWGCRGGTCRSESCPRLTTTWNPPNRWNLFGSISLGEGGNALWLRRRLPRSRPRRPPRRPRRRSKALLFVNRFVNPLRAGVLWSPGPFFRYERKPKWFPLIGRSLRDGPALFPVYGWDLNQ